MTNRSLASGNIPKGILYFMIPVVASSLIQQLYSTVDLIIVGQYLGTQSSAAIGASNLIVTCLVGFFTGMSVGTGVITSHAFGENNESKLKKIISTSFIFGVVGGIALMIIGVVLATTFLSTMNTPETILKISSKYLRIYMLSMVPIVVYNLSSGIVRSIGDSKTPMMLQIYGGIINVIADIIFIVILKMGVEGAAMATFLSQTLVSILIVIYLKKLNPEIALNIKSLIFDKSILKSILQIGIPAGIQSIAITLSNIIIQANINSFGIDAIAAFTAYFKIELILYIPIVALGQSVIVFIGQNIGARQFKRANIGLKYCIAGGIIAIGVGSFILLLVDKQLFSIFSRNLNVILLGANIVNITFPFYFLYVILECMGAAIRGMGKSIQPMLIIILSFCGFRIIILIELLKKWNDIRSIAYTYPISWAMASLLMIIYYFVIRMDKVINIYK